MSAAGEGGTEILSKGGKGVRALVRRWYLKVADVFRGAPKLSLFFLTLTIVCAIAAPLLPFDPVRGDLTNPLQPPTWGAHPLGTDHQGRDMVVRLIHGANISITVGFLAVFVSGATGTIVAVVAGVFKGWIDGLLIQITDAFLALPFLMVAVAVVSLLGPSKTNVILVLGLLRWMSYARVLRSEVLSITETDYVRLAKVAGSSNWRIILRHVLPNLTNTLLIISTLELGTVIIFESGIMVWNRNPPGKKEHPIDAATEQSPYPLAYHGGQCRPAPSGHPRLAPVAWELVDHHLDLLGLGVPRPLPSWGTMLADSQSYISIRPREPPVAGPGMASRGRTRRLAPDHRPGLHHLADWPRRERATTAIPASVAGG